ncbi:serine-rich adhesin for platelets-like isoform X2 [Alosa sapidissima]|uniref:serine-rich adhesin for platelets-like isoform X2 n=1 Tax=Alosa sapidissima TaxID=34773 RepID=UPI001C0A1441|nr:serine-rich adhesin for platelets-like isoform X2 [Alosa sapidissima]
MWRNSAMEEPSTLPGASEPFTRRKLGEKVVCSRKEYRMYQDYVDDIKNDFQNNQQRERQKRLLELEEQGLILDNLTGEDIRTFLQTNELPRHDGPQQQHGLEQTKKTTIKEKNGLNGGKLPSITTQQTSTRDKTRLHLNENEIKHELNRNRYMRDIQEKRRQREMSISKRRAAAQQAEVDRLTKNLRDLEKMRVHTKDQTKLLYQVFGKSTSVKSPQKITVPRRPTLRPLAPLPARGHDITTQTSSPDTKLLSPSVYTPYLQLPCLGQLKMLTNQHDPEPNKKARITQALLDHLSSDSFKMQIAECIQNETTLTSGERRPHVATRVLRGKLATDILLCLFRTVRPSKLFVESPEHHNQSDTSSAKQFYPYVTEIINSVLGEIRVKVLERLRFASLGNSPKISPQTFERALNGLSLVLQNLETGLILVEAIAADIHEQAPRTETPVEESGTRTLAYQVEAISGDLIRIAHGSIACSPSNDEARTSKLQRHVQSGNTQKKSQVEPKAEAMNAPIVKKEDTVWEALDQSQPFDVANKTKNIEAKISYIYPPTMAGASRALSSTSSSSCSVAVFQSEKCGSLQESEVSTPESTSDELEMLAGASSTTSVALSSPTGVTTFKTVERGPISFKTVKTSTSEGLLVEVETAAGTSCTPSRSLEKSTEGSPIDQNNLDWNIKDNALCSLPKDTTVASQMSKEVFNWSSSMINQHLAVQNSQSEEIHLSMPSVALDSTSSDANQVSVENGVYTATRSQSLPSFFPVIADEVMQYLTSPICKERITQAMKNELKRSLSGNDLPSSNLNVGPEERRAIRNVFKKVSKELSHILSRERILSLWPNETTGPSPDHDTLLSQVNAVALQLIETVFSEVKEQLVNKIKQESPKRGVTPLGSQTTIKAVCTSLEDMKMTLGNEMSFASASGMLLSVSSENAEVGTVVQSQVDTMAETTGAPSGLEAFKTEGSQSVILQEAEISSLEMFTNEVETLAGASGALSGSSSPQNSLGVFKIEESRSVIIQKAKVSADSPALSNASPSSSCLEVFKTEESRSVILQDAEVATLQMSAEEVETLTGASGALSGSSFPSSSLEVFKTEEVDMLTGASPAFSNTSSSSSGLEVFKTEESLLVILRRADVSSLEVSSNEIETLAGASGALSGSSSTTNSLEVFKTEESRSVIIEEAKVSTLEMSAKEVEMLAGASPALSPLSSSTTSSLEVFKTEESRSVIIEEAKVSTLEMSAEEVEMLAGASPALSNASPSSSCLEVFKTEESRSVILQEAEVATLVMSVEEVETLAGASGALSGSSFPSTSLEVFKTEESRSVINQEAKVSTLEMSAKEVEMLAGASPALSGASYSSNGLVVFKTEESQSAILQEATQEISSDTVEVLAGASSTPSVASSSPSSSQCSRSQEIQLSVPSFTLESTGSDTKRVYTTIKSQSLPCLYPAIAKEVIQYFTTSFKDRITQAVKYELKRTFSVKELSSTPQPKLGPEERRAIRTTLKTISKELNALMSREHILSLLSVETAACGSPEHDVLLDQLNAAASQQIEAVFSEVKENLATKINQESSKRGVSPLASQTAMQAVCKSLEDIKMTLIGDEMSIPSTSGIQLSVSSEDTNVVHEMSSANNMLPGAKTPSTISLGSQTPHAATKSLSLPNFYPIIANEVLQHFSTTSFKDHVRQILKKEYKRSQSLNDITSVPQQKQGPEERHFTRDMLRSVSRELNASMSRQSESMLPETLRPSSAPIDDTLLRLNAVALKLINRVYGQVKEKLTAAIKQESPKRGLSFVASQTAVKAACRTLDVIERTLIDGARSPSTSPSQLQKSKDLEREIASEETLEVENSSSSIDVVTDELIENVVTSIFLDTDSALSSRAGTPTQRVGGGTWLNEVVKQSVNMSPTGSKAYSTKSPDDNNVSLPLGSFTHLLPRITDEILEHFSTACFKDCIIQSVNNVMGQHVSAVNIKDIMEVIVKSVYHKMALLINRNTADSQIVEHEIPKPEMKELPVLEVEDPWSAHELASTIKQITVAALNHLSTQLKDKIKQKSSSQEESELVINALSETLGTMVACISNIQFFSEELHCYICKINNIPTQKLIGQWISLSKLDFISICLATSVLDVVYHDDSATTSNSKTSQNELEANSRSSESIIAPSKPVCPATKMSFRARKWSSCSTFQKSADTAQTIAVYSKSLEVLPRTDMKSDNEDRLESLSSWSMSTSSSISSLEEKRSHLCSPVLKRVTASKSVMNFSEELQMDYTMQPKPPCKKSDQSFQNLPVRTTKTFGRRKVRLHTIFRNPEEFSDEESSNTSCSAPEDLHTSSSEEDLSLTSHKRHSK